MLYRANVIKIRILIAFVYLSKRIPYWEFDHICYTEQTWSKFVFWLHLLIWANVFNTMNLIIFAIQSKLCQYEEFASSYQPMQTSSILWVWIPLLTQVNTSNFRFWTHFQPFVSLLVTVSLRVFTSEANVVQKSKSAH